MSVIVNQALDYEAKASPSIMYRMTTVLPDGAAPSVIPLAADVPVTFRIPTSSCAGNLSKSRLQLTYTAASLVSKFTFLNVSRPPITRVDLRTVSGVQLASIAQYDQFAAIVLPVTTKREALQTETPVSSARSLAVPGGCPTFPIGAVAATNSGFSAYTTQAGAVTVPLANIDASAEWVTAGSATAVSMSWDCMFKDLFPHSVLSCPQDLVFPEDLVLTIYLAAATKNAFTADDISAATPVACVSAGSVSAVQVQFARQMSKDIENRLVQQFATQGLIVPTQDVSAQVESQGYPSAATTTYSRNARLDGSRGQALLRFYFGATSVDDQKTKSACAYNLGASAAVGALWDSAAVSIDNIRMSNAMLPLVEIFDSQRPLFYESAAYNFGLWCQLGSAFVSDFTGGVDLSKMTPSSGLPLISELRPSGFNWGIEVLKSQTSYALNIVTVYVFLRRLVLSPSGVMLQ